MTEYNRENLTEILTSKVATVTFEKADGTIRTMLCTLMPEHLPKPVPLAEGEEPKPARKPSETSMSVWDVKQQGWRSFRFDKIKEVA